MTYPRAATRALKEFAAIASAAERVAGEREWCIIERLHQRAGDQMRLAVPALARPCMQRELMLLRRLVSGGKIGDTRLAERDIGKCGRARRLVIDFGAAENGNKSVIGTERIAHGGAKRG